MHAAESGNGHGDCGRGTRNKRWSMEASLCEDYHVKVQKDTVERVR